MALKGKRYLLVPSGDNVRTPGIFRWRDARYRDDAHAVMGALGMLDRQARPTREGKVHADRVSVCRWDFPQCGPRCDSWTYVCDVGEDGSVTVEDVLYVTPHGEAVYGDGRTAYGRLDETTWRPW